MGTYNTHRSQPARTIRQCTLNPHLGSEFEEPLPVCVAAGCAPSLGADYTAPCDSPVAAARLLAGRSEAKPLLSCTPRPRLIDKILVHGGRWANVANLPVSTYDPGQQCAFAAASAW